MYQFVNVVKRALTVDEFRAVSESSDHVTPSYADDYERLEKQFWCAWPVYQCCAEYGRKTLSFGRAIYGADLLGSISDPSKKARLCDPPSA